jgi:hypothetical protein
MNKTPIDVKLIINRVTLISGILCLLLTLAGTPWAIASLPPEVSTIVQIWALIVATAWAGSRLRRSGGWDK